MTQEPTAKLVIAAKAVLASLQNDESRHGGLITRETIRLGDELRLALAKFEKEQAR